MESILDHIETIGKKAAGLAETKIELAKLRATEKLSDITSTVISLVAIVFSIILAFVVISVGIAFSIGYSLGHVSYGFYIIGAFYLLLGLLLFLFRKQWLINPISNLLIDKMTK